MGLTRRDLLKAAAAGITISEIALPGTVCGEAMRTVRIGFLAPLSGNVAPWGLPGLYGAELWAKNVNSSGGIRLGDDAYLVEIDAFDDKYLWEPAFRGFQKLVENDVKFIMMLGGNTWPAVQQYANRHKMLVSTLLPSDLSPDTPYLIAPCEVHPLYNVTGVEWLAQKNPELKTVAICAQDDSLGHPSVATYLAAFEAAGIRPTDVRYFSPSTTKVDDIVKAMLQKNPDILCWDTAYPEFVVSLTEAAFQQGFEGRMISCTCDDYRKLVRTTSEEFMEGFVFQFPNFNDPALQASQVNFPRPAAFYRDYQKAHPGMWSAVSWEFPAILDLWKASTEKAGSFDPLAVLAAMKADPTPKNVFGRAQWWGKELWGINNALVGYWPVVEIQKGEPHIVAFNNILDWWARHKNLLLKQKAIEEIQSYPQND